MSKWRARFVEQRRDGLLDAPRLGAPRSIDDPRVEAMIARTLALVPVGATHWSTRRMARATGLSQTAVARIWRAVGLQPHRQETFKLPTDPLFVEKGRDSVGRDQILVHPGPRCPVHFTPTSASWLNPVEPGFATLTEKYIRRGTHGSTRQLEQAIRQYLDSHNANPKPFAGPKSADDILVSIE